AVAEYLGNSRVNFIGVVAHADDGIGAHVVAVFHHQAISVGARLFAKLGVDGDVAAEKRLEPRADVAHETARPDHDAANDSQIAFDSISRQFKGRRDILRAHWHSLAPDS